MGDRKGTSDHKFDKTSQPDEIVAWVAFVLWQIHRALILPLYRWEAALWARVGFRPLYFNYPYVVQWVCILVVCLLFAGSNEGVQITAAVVALWRLAELVTWYLRLLLDRDHRRFWSVERNLLFLMLDSFAVITGVATLLRIARPTESPTSSWLSSLGVFTLNGQPDRHSGPWSDTATAIGTLSGLLLVVAALAIVVELIGGKFEVGSNPYTGPRGPDMPRAPRLREPGRRERRGKKRGRRKSD